MQEDVEQFIQDTVAVGVDGQGQAVQIGTQRRRDLRCTASPIWHIRRRRLGPSTKVVA